MLITKNHIGRKVKTSEKEGVIYNYIEGTQYPVLVEFNKIISSFTPEGKFTAGMDSLTLDIVWMDGDTGRSDEDSLSFFRRVMGGIV